LRSKWKFVLICIIYNCCKKKRYFWGMLSQSIHTRDSLFWNSLYWGGISCPSSFIIQKRVSISTTDSTLLRYETHARRNILPQCFTCKQICTTRITSLAKEKLSGVYLYLHAHRIIRMWWPSSKYDAWRLQRELHVVTRTTM